MASAANIVLAATGISFANEWWNDGTPNFRILMAGGLFSLIAAGLSDLNEPAGKGIAGIMFITVMLTPINGHSPVQTLAELPIARPRKRGHR